MRPEIQLAVKHRRDFRQKFFGFLPVLVLLNPAYHQLPGAEIIRMPGQEGFNCRVSLGLFFLTTADHRSQPQRLGVIFAFSGQVVQNSVGLLIAML